MDDPNTVGDILETTLHPDEVKRRSFRGVISFLVRTLLLTGVALIAQLILGAALNPADYGIYGIVVTITNFFTIISDIGLAASLIQKKEEPTTLELRTVFTVQQILAWLVFALISLTAIVMYHFGRLSIEGVYLSLAFGVSFPIVSIKTISSILLERHLLFDKLIIPAIVETIVFNIVAVYLALHGYGVMSFTYGVIAKAVVGVVVMLAIRRWPMGFAFSKKNFIGLMKVGGAFQLNDMLAKAKDDLFYLTVSFVIPAQEYGYITWAKQWSRLPYSLTVDNVTALTFPAFARLQHDKSLLRRAIEKTIFFITIIAFPLLGGLSIMVFPLIHVIPRYEKWAPAIVSLILFCFSLAFAAFSTPLISTLNAIGKINQTLKMMVFWTASQWVLFPFLFRFFGYQAVAIVAAVISITSLYVVRLVSHYVEFSFIENIWRQTTATIMMIVILYFGQSYWSMSFLHFSEGVILGGVVFVGMMLVLGFEKTKMEVLSLLKKR